MTVGFKDLGAGGIMGCSAEIISAGGYGARIDLDAVNVAVEGMRPEVIAVGETQERLDLGRAAVGHAATAAYLQRRVHAAGDRLQRARGRRSVR